MLEILTAAELEAISKGHAMEDKTWAEQRLGSERILGAYAWRSLREAGRWADLTAMSVDPFVLADQGPGDILSGRIVMTIVNGKVIYER